MKGISEHYYYIRDDVHRPIITVCLIKLGKHVAKGVAICSDKDNPCKKTGRAIAKGRANKAMFNEMNCSEINRYNLSSVENAADETEVDAYYKALFNPTLTEFEQKLLKKPAQINRIQEDEYDQQNLPFLIKERILFGSEKQDYNR